MSRRARWLAALALLMLATASLLVPFAPIAQLIDPDPALATTILLELRLPRTMLALGYGAMLGGSGAAIQALFANPLASPDITGASSGAALGAVVTAYLLGLTGPLPTMAGAMLGALAALGLLLALAGPRAGTATLLLAGIAISAVAAAATTLALALAPSPFAFYDAYAWLMGSLIDRSLTQLAFAAVPMVVALALLAARSGALDALALGEETAEALGHNLIALRRTVVIASALGVGAGVAVCGAVGFIGLVAPVLARRLTRGHPGRAIGGAAVIGAILLCAADLVTRAVPLGRALPVGVVTALIGAPFFLALVARMRWDRRG